MGPLFFDLTKIWACFQGLRAHLTKIQGDYPWVFYTFFDFKPLCNKGLKRSANSQRVKHALPSCYSFFPAGENFTAYFEIRSVRFDEKGIFGL